MTHKRIASIIATMAATLILAGCGTPIMVNEAPSSAVPSVEATPSPEHYVPQAEPSPEQSSTSEPAKVQVKPTTKPVEDPAPVETYDAPKPSPKATGVDDTMPDGPSKVVTPQSDDKVTTQSVETEPSPTPSPEPVEEAPTQPEPCTDKSCKTAGNGSIGNGIDNRPKQ